MIEDEALNAFLKAKLEEDVTVPPVNLGVVGRWRPRFRRIAPAAALAAASLMVVCTFLSWKVEQRSRSNAADICAIRVIDFLEECDGTAVEGANESLAERLLAWQDAPYEEVAL